MACTEDRQLSPFRRRGGRWGHQIPCRFSPFLSRDCQSGWITQGQFYFFFFHYEQLCLEQQDLDLGITFQESGAALQKPRWCLSSVCRGLEGSQERRWSCGFGVERDFRELVGKVCVSQIPLAFISSVPRSELSRPYAHFGNCFICPPNILYWFQFINLLKSMKQIITWEY